MSILLAPVPLFTKEMTMEACYFRYQKGNDLTGAGIAAGLLDGAMNSPVLETLRNVGVEAFAMDNPVFVPVSPLMLLGDLSRQCPEPYDKIVFLLDGEVEPSELTIAKMRELTDKGFRFGMFRISDVQKYKLVLQECEYLFLNQKSAASQIGPFSLPPHLRRLKLVATHVDTAEEFAKVKDRGFKLFEGNFYRLPLTKGRAAVAPLKVNLVRILNTVQDPDFEFEVLAQIIERDTALTLSLMKLVNSPHLRLPGKIKTINHAIAMLGESEVRKWVATSVSRQLGSDKHDEVTRLSLIRAKFAENLAKCLDMRIHERSLFLMGIFSVLDVVLDVSMQEAVKLVRVDDNIKNALVNGSGPFAAVHRFILAYEQADWTSISRELIISGVAVDDIFDAYIDATLWYKTLMEEAEEAFEETVQ